MNTTLKTKNLKWILIAGVALMLFLAAGAIYAQGYGRHGGGQGRPGQGGGRQMGGQGRFQRGGPGGGQGLGGMMYLMRDPDIREMMMEIRTISAINELGLSRDQVDKLLGAARDAQTVTDKKFGSLRGEVKTALESQLDAVIKGGKFDEDAFKAIKEKCKDQNPGEIRDQLKPILDRAMGILTDEQRDKFAKGRDKDQFGDRGDGQGRFQQQRMKRGDGEGQGKEMMGKPGEGRMMMFLLNPKTVGALEKWLAAHKEAK